MTAKRPSANLGHARIIVICMEHDPADQLVLPFFGLPLVGLKPCAVQTTIPREHGLLQAADGSPSR